MKKISKPLFSLCVAMLLSPSLAACNNEPKSYQVLFKNYDNSILYQTSVKEGESAVYVGDDPTRQADDHYQYVFSGWDKPLTNITQDTTFVAQYEKTNDYVVSFYTYDGTNLTLLQRSFVKNGDSVTYSGETPTKKADFDYYYTFKEWDKSFDKITSNLDVFATYDATSNVKDFDPNYDFWIYKFTDELDVSNCSFKGARDGLSVELVKPVIVDGKEVTSHHVNFTEMEIDLSNVKKDKVGEYETTITYRGISKKEVIDVIPDENKLDDEEVQYMSAGGHTAEPGPDWLRADKIYFYKYRDGEGDDEIFAQFDTMSELYQYKRFEKNDHDYINFYRVRDGVYEDLRYKLRLTGGGHYEYVAEYDFPEYDSEVDRIPIVNDECERELIIFKKLTDESTGYGQIENDGDKLAVKYEYDDEKKTLRVCHLDYPRPLTYNESDRKFHL